jgi:hypothetical protein|tara:strand:+ start:3034 stop:3351 length:318 start_codon:yes stop_codon:yes gene_type:complete
MAKGRRGMSEHAIKHVIDLMHDGQERTVEETITALLSTTRTDVPNNTRRTLRNIVPTRNELQFFFGKSDKFVSRVVKRWEPDLHGTMYQVVERVYRRVYQEEDKN